MSAPTRPAPESIDTAWRLHAIVVDWTGKVDAKASFALSIESAALAAIVVMFGGGHRLARVHGIPGTATLWTGNSLILAAVLLATWAVIPRMRSNPPVEPWPDNFVYFGHLRQWKPELLTTALKTEDPLPALSRQLVVISTIAWRKHRLVQLSLLTAVIGLSLVGIAALAVG